MSLGLLDAFALPAQLNPLMENTGRKVRSKGAVLDHLSNTLATLRTQFVQANLKKILNWV